MNCLKLILLVTFFLLFKSYSQTEKVNERYLTKNEFDNRYASYNSKGNKIVFESNRDKKWNIYLMNSDGTNQVKLTSNGANNRRPSWLHNDNIILFESNISGKNELYEYSLETKSIKKVPIKVNDKITFSRFSPDGKSIAFSAEEKENNINIYIVNRDGSNLKQLVDNSYRNVYPTFSPDGSQLLFFSRKDTENNDDEIYTYNLKTKKEERLTNWPKHNFCPTWSGDGKKIAYVTSMENSRPEIYIMNSDGSNKQRITYNKDGDTLPNWSPDNSKLLITAFRNGSYQICEIKIK